MHQLHRSSQQVLFRPAWWLPCFTLCVTKLFLYTCVFSCLLAFFYFPFFCTKKKNTYLHSFYLQFLFQTTPDLLWPHSTSTPFATVTIKVSSSLFSCCKGEAWLALLSLSTKHHTPKWGPVVWLHLNGKPIHTAVIRSRGYLTCIRNHLSNCWKALVCESEVGLKKSHLSHIVLCHPSS